MKLLDIINEAKEYADDEIVDFNEINLQHEFDKLNALLFNNELYPIEMMWNRTRSAHGQVKAQKFRRTGEVVIKSLSISKFLAITYKHFKDVLAHEMIHIYWLQKHINAGHDYRFIKEMDRINAMGLGFNVTLKADSSQFELSKETKEKKRNLVFFISKVDDEEGSRISVIGYNLYKTKGYRVSKIYEYLTEKGKYHEVNCDFYISDNPELNRYSIQKNLNNLGYLNISDQDAKQYEEGSKWLAGFVTRSGESTWEGDDLPAFN